jgi:ABC-type nickel/cobalt efflux system permease component RcnA
MPAWGWAIVIVAVVIVIALALWQLWMRQRTKQLQQRFGPEYDRTLRAREDRHEAEAELKEREERRKELDIVPLTPAAHEGYVSEWKAVQAQFVDDPAGAVAAADTLIQRVMSERGYPVDDFEQRAADVSVDHPHVVEHYRQGHRLAVQNRQGAGDTEQLRQAMRHYRALFEELVEETADEPMTREPDTTQEGTVRKA